MHLKIGCINVKKIVDLLANEEQKSMLKEVLQERDRFYWDGG
jgi:hypothetical protein